MQVQSDFSDVSPRLREVCEMLSPHLLYMLTTPLAAEYKVRPPARPPARGVPGKRYVPPSLVWPKLCLCCRFCMAHTQRKLHGRGQGY